MDAIVDQLTERKTIGVFVSLPSDSPWGEGGFRLFKRRVGIALQPLIVPRVEAPFSCCYYCNELLSLIGVNDLSAGLRALCRELESLELLPFSHIAWHDVGEGTWRNEVPKNGIIPFEDRLLVIKAWRDDMNKINDTFEQAKALHTKLRSKQLPPEAGNA